MPLSINESFHSSTSIESNAPACRTCFEKEKDGKRSRLINPCGCKGSESYIHVKCLNRWLRSEDKARSKSPQKCEVCQEDYRGLTHVEVKMSFIQFMKLPQVSEFIKQMLVYGFIATCMAVGILVLSFFAMPDENPHSIVLNIIGYGTNGVIMFLMIIFVYLVLTVFKAVSMRNAYRIWQYVPRDQETATGSSSSEETRIDVP